jgi:transcriptional regulator with XRE-family HTH domain
MWRFVALLEMISAMEHVGQMLARERALHGLTQADLAWRAGTSAAAVCRIECGKVSPSIDTFARLMLAMGETLLLDRRRSVPTTFGGIEKPTDWQLSRGVTQLIRSIEQAGVDYMGCGYVALQVHDADHSGHPLGMVVHPVEDNLRRIRSVLPQAHMSANAPYEDHNTEAGVVRLWSLSADQFDRFAANARYTRFAGHEVRVLDREDLVRLYLQAADEPHAEAIALLSRRLRIRELVPG